MVNEQDQSWREQALCAQTDPEAFFPNQGGSPRLAKQICMQCPVRRECLKFALDNNERFGVWGGYSERERRALRPSARPMEGVA
ncbi:WhiB family transcriptional regulator [Mycobacterium sp. M1]|uniref:Transcriptional regulator WhiB n=2 Tax=Mycolicibacter acidiphilus TaxID=2835306 RepID=A0ABS5RE94_9MYCO|nr:WhiB family transcriptional regulator [Mycolicibacter acidiphilus]